MSSVAATKLLGIMDLTDVQKGYLRCAYVMQKANGNVDARGRDGAAFKACMRRFVKWELATERFSGVFGLTRTGMDLGAALTCRKTCPTCSGSGICASGETEYTCRTCLGHKTVSR